MSRIFSTEKLGLVVLGTVFIKAFWQASFAWHYCLSRAYQFFCCTSTVHQWTVNLCAMYADDTNLFNYAQLSCLMLSKRTLTADNHRLGLPNVLLLQIVLDVPQSSQKKILPSFQMPKPETHAFILSEWRNDLMRAVFIGYQIRRGSSRSLYNL